MTVLPRKQAPTLVVDTLSHGRFDLRESTPKTFTMVVFYRGRHCGFCRRYLQDLKIKLADFERRGIEIVAVSTDSNDRAQASMRDWELSGLRIGYGLTLQAAADWDLYISTGINDEQPPYFCEPGLFLLTPDRSVYAVFLQNLPWARPRFEDVLFMVDFNATRSKPARGEVVLDSLGQIVEEGR